MVTDESKNVVNFLANPFSLTLILANSSMAALAAAAATRGSTTLARKATVDMIGLPKHRFKSDFRGNE